MLWEASLLWWALLWSLCVWSWLCSECWKVCEEELMWLQTHQWPVLWGTCVCVHGPSFPYSFMSFKATFVLNFFPEMCVCVSLERSSMWRTVSWSAGVMLPLLLVWPLSAPHCRSVNFRMESWAAIPLVSSHQPHSLVNGNWTGY